MSSNRTILAVIVFGIFLRIVFVWRFVDIGNINQWEYGEIAKNVVHNNGYSLFYFENDSLEYKYKEDVKPFSSAYMPPGYVFIILPFYFIENDFIINLIIISLQILCSAAVIFFLFKLCANFFNKNIALVSTLIYAFLPEFIYACVSFSPTVLFHLLIVLVLYRLQVHNKTNGLDILLPVLLAAIIYLRSEFILFVLLLIMFYIIYKQYRQALSYIVLILFLILPWSIRNSIIFDSLVPLTTNFGQNLYRGNNSSDVGWWGEEIMIEKVKELPRDKSFEIHLNQLYLNRAINYIKENPIRFVSNGFRKQFELWFFNLSDTRAKLLIYLIPAISIFCLFIIGIIRTFNVSKYKYFYLFFLQATILSAIFFSLPRYQTMMKVLMLPFAVIGMFFLFDIFKRYVFNTESKI
ncbi:MAG: glycosyltransferase family 39 protein [Ignavibacteriales bacterium]|nr:glycosyltransferase family 39 protein [Ignavibacteriales bacterium]